MTEGQPSYGDAMTAPFWEGASRGELLVQRCRACGSYQFYPRPFCLACDASDLEWIASAGRGTVHAKTTVHIQVDSALEPPYDVGIVALDEGPRLVANLVGEPAIGETVRVAWRERADAPPLPVFTRKGEAD